MPSYYDWSKNYKAAIIYYNDIVRKQPKSADAETAKNRIEELRSQYGDDILRVGSERAESGESSPFADVCKRRSKRPRCPTTADRPSEISCPTSFLL